MIFLFYYQVKFEKDYKFHITRILFLEKNPKIS